jgi:glucose-6-phosphate 1-epimerase
LYFRYGIEHYTLLFLEFNSLSFRTDANLRFFKVFGPPPKNHATSSLPQHGFARNSYWEFLGKSSSESLGNDTRKGDDSIVLDFGLSSAMLSEPFRKAWPYDFGLVYSVTLTKDSLRTSLRVQNQGNQPFEFQFLVHTYLRIKVGYETYPDL